MIHECGYVAIHELNFASYYLQNFGFTEVGQPITVEVPLEQTDNCVTDTDGSGSTTLYGSVITMMLCWMATMITAVDLQ